MKLRAILVDVLLIEEHQYQDAYGPDDIETWDSLAAVRIATAVKEEFGYELQPLELVSIATIGDIKDVLRERLRLTFD